MRRRSVPFISASYEELPRAQQDPVANAEGYCCDLCGKDCEGLPCGNGLLIWQRGTELRYEEPPLCEECASRVTMGALLKSALEDEEEG